jgi:hypothetical protein
LLPKGRKNDALIELQTKHPDNKPRRPIGFIQPKDDEAKE